MDHETLAKNLGLLLLQAWAVQAENAALKQSMKMKPVETPPSQTKQ